MKLIAVNGSPRKEGNCHQLIKVIASVLEKEEILCEEVQLGQIQSCIACYKCFEKQSGQCVVTEDSFNAIQEKLVESDGLLLVSPVFSGSVSGSMKSFMERSSLVSMASGGLFDRKPAAALSVARRAGTLSALEPMHNYLNICGMITMGSTYWNVGFGGDKGEVLKDAEGMETLHNLSKNLAWLMKTVQASPFPQPETPRTTATNFIRDDL